MAKSASLREAVGNENLSRNYGMVLSLFSLFVDRMLHRCQSLFIEGIEQSSSGAIAFTATPSVQRLVKIEHVTQADHFPSPVDVGALLNRTL